MILTKPELLLSIVGLYYSSGMCHGFLYNGSTWTTLDKPLALETFPQGISSNGRNIVGGYYDIGFGGPHGFLYDGLTWTTLDAPGASITGAYGIDGGKIVGSYTDAIGTHGFLYDGSTWMTLDAPGSTTTRAFGINGGKIVGCYTDASGTHAFVYNPEPPTSDKRGANGSTIVIQNMVVNAEFSDGFYVEKENRAWGIRVEGYNQALEAGKRVNITGTLKTTPDGERYILTDSDSVNPLGSPIVELRPLGMTNKLLGGGNLAYDQATGAGQIGVTGGAGLNNIGLLVRTWGKVTEFDSSTIPTWFVIDDGSGVDVRCEAPSDVAIHKTWTYVAVTGISRLNKVGSDYKRRISVRMTDDITVMNENPPDAPAFVLGFHTNDMPTEWITLIGNWPDGATSMKLYQSADGIHWTPTSTPVQHEETWGCGFATLQQLTNAYFRLTAANSGGESVPSDIIHARPFEVEHGIVVDLPSEGQTGVSRTPTFTWHAAWSQSILLKRYTCEVHKLSSYENMWWILTAGMPPQTSVVFGQTEGVTTNVPASGPLAPYTEYWVYITAQDSENWQFATCYDRRFTTGP